MSDGAPILSFKAPEPDDDLQRHLRAGQQLMLQHPAAAQSLFRALVREGRAYAQTDEGAALRQQVARSELMRRGRVIWEGVTLNILEEDGDSPLPSALLEAFLAASDHPDAETLLAGLFDPEAPLRGPDTDHSPA